MKELEMKFHVFVLEYLLLFMCVPEKFKNMCTAASGEGERRAVILEVLSKGVPVTAFLVLIAAAGGGRTRRRRAAD